MFFDNTKSLLNNRKYILIALHFFMIIYVVLFSTNALSVEKEFHLQTLNNIREYGFKETIFGEKYMAANTPLPYIIAYFWGLLFGYDLISIRILTILFSFITLLILLRILDNLGNNLRNNFLIVLLILFYPYYLKQAITFHPPIYGLAFLFASIYHLNFENKKSLLLCGFLASLAVLCQQFYVAVPAGVSIFLIIKVLQKKNSIKDGFYSLAFYLLPFVIPMILFILWGGLVHQNFKEHEIGLVFSNLTAILVIIGFYFFIITFYSVKLESIKRFSFFSLPLIILFIFAYPKWSEIHGFGNISGFVWHFLELIKYKSLILSKLIAFILFMGGGYFLFNLIKFNSDNDKVKIFKISAIVSILIYFGNVLLTERRILLLIILLYVLLSLLNFDYKLLLIMLLVNISLSIYYIYDWFFIRFAE